MWLEIYVISDKENGISLVHPLGIIHRLNGWDA